MSLTRWKLAVGSAAAVAVLIVGPTTAYARPPGPPSPPPGPPTPSGAAVLEVTQSPYGPVLVTGSNIDPDPNAPSGYDYPAGSALYFPTIDPVVRGSSAPGQQLPGPGPVPPGPGQVGPGGPGGPGAHGPAYQPGCNATTSAVSDLNEFFSGTSLPPETCTGPESDVASADWPALTTTARPVAGPGVDARLVGWVYRSDLNAYQVTYGGHPLYLFDPGPASFFGENFVETVEPTLPWHTLWYLVSPNGDVDPGPANLVAEDPASGLQDPQTGAPGSTTYGSPVLAVTLLPGEGGLPVTVYTLHGQGPAPVRCDSACASEFIPLRTTGQPTALGLAGTVGTAPLPDGTTQATYNGQPLFVYNQEEPLFLFGGTPPYGPGNLIGIQTVGNGEGVSAFGGTLSVVNP